MGADREVCAVEPVAGCPPEIGASLWTLQEARRRTLSSLDSISQEALDYEPPGQRYGVSTLLYHIAVFETDWLYVDILGGGYDMERRVPESPPEVAAHLSYPLLMEDGTYTPVSGEPLDEHLERLSVVRRASLDTLASMSLEEFRTARLSGEDEVTPEWVVEHLAQHEAEHRGQIWEARISAETAFGIE